MKNLLVIFERYLTSDGQRLRIGGVVSRNVAHSYGVPHGAVQIAIVVLRQFENTLEPHIILHLRDERKKICPKKWDICGGHIDADETLFKEFDKWHNWHKIEQLFNRTALRELNEEFCIKSRPEFKLEEKHLYCFGGPGIFESGFDDHDNTNKEYSTFYVAFIPQEILTVKQPKKNASINEDSDFLKGIFSVRDTVGILGEKKEKEPSILRLITLNNLVAEFRKNPNDYADGIARILKRAIDEPGTMKELNRLLISYHKN